MDDAVHRVSPDHILKALGNCQTIETNTVASISTVWTAYRRARLERIESCPMGRTQLRAVALMLVYGIESTNRKSGEDVGAAVTSTYGYDYLNQRVRQAVLGTGTTTYVGKYFDKLINGSQSTTTAYIYLGDTLIATVQGNGTATTTSYVHPDHLGSTNVVTDADGETVQTLDYYPYGSTRIDSGTDVSQREFIGERLDESTSLSYLNARYLESQRGQFLSQDPVFNEDPIRQNLTNPQSLNSYLYANGNPIVNKDPSGRCIGPAIAFCVPIALATIGGLAGFGGTYASDVIENRVNGAESPYAMTSSPGAYAAGTLFGAATPFVAGPKLVVAGASAFGTSVTQDIANGNSPNFAKATIATGIAVGTGGFIRSSLGISPLEKTGQSIVGNVSSSLFRQELRYSAVTETFNMSTNVLSQRNFQQPQSTQYKSSTPVSSGQPSGSGGSGGSFAAISRTLSAISGLISSIWGK